MSVGNLIGSVAAPFISSGLNSLLGTGKKNKNVLNYAQPYDLGPPLGFSGDLGAGAVGLDYAKPSLTGYSATGGGYRFGTTLNPDGTVSGGIDNSGSLGAKEFGSRFGRSLSDIDSLRAGLQPGFGKVTQARRDAVEDARVKAVGDLRDTLARRRVEGSSFGNASVAQADAEFARQRADADAKSYLEELDATSRLLGQEFDQTLKARQADLAELGISTQQIAAFADAAMRDQQLRMQLAEQDLGTRRSLYGQDLASRRNAGVTDLMNRRNLAAEEDAADRKYFRGVGDNITRALGGTSGSSGKDFAQLVGLLG